MTRILRCGFIVVGVALLTGADGPEWKEFVSPEFEFKVLFPGEPEPKTFEEQGKTLHGFVSREPVDGLGFAVQCFDGGPPVRSKQEERRALDNFARGVAAKAKSVSQSDATLGGATARQIYAEASGGQVMVIRACVAKGRFYSVAVAAADAEAIKSPLVGKFLDSFQVLNYTPPVLPEEDLERNIFYKLGQLSVPAAIVAFILFISYRQKKDAQARAAAQAQAAARTPAAAAQGLQVSPPPVQEGSYPQFIADMSRRLPGGAEGGLAFVTFLGLVVGGFFLPPLQNFVGGCLLIAVAFCAAYLVQRWRNRKFVRQWIGRVFVPEARARGLDPRELLNQLAEVRYSTPPGHRKLAALRPLLAEVLNQEGRSTARVDAGK